MTRSIDLRAIAARYMGEAQEHYLYGRRVAWRAAIKIAQHYVQAALEAEQKERVQ